MTGRTVRAPTTETTTVGILHATIDEAAAAMGQWPRRLSPAFRRRSSFSGSSSDGGCHLRTGGEGRGSGGGGHTRRSGPAGKGSRGKGGHGHGHSSSDDRGRHRGHSRGSAYGAGGSSSSEDRSKSPKIIVVSGTRQVVPSWVAVTSSAELLSRLTICDDRTKPASSNVANARTSATNAAAAAAEAKHTSTVKRAYVTLPVKDITRI